VDATEPGKYNKILHSHRQNIGLLGAVHKGCPQSGVREVCPVQTFFAQGGFFRCNRLHFLVQKLWIFEIYGVSVQTKGVEPVRTFCGQGGKFFRDFMWMSFMDGSLVKEQNIFY